MSYYVDTDALGRVMISSSEYPATITFFGVPGESPDKTIARGLVAIVTMKNDKSHLRVVDCASGKIYHPAQKVPLNRVSDALRWASSLDGSEDYILYRIMPDVPACRELLAAYAPARRSSISSEWREEVYKKYSGHCAYCGKPIDISEMQVDHVESHYRHMGKDELANYMPSCRDCNGLKSDYTLEEFRNVLIPKCAGYSVGRKGRIAKAYKLNAISRKKIVFYFEKEEKPL